MSAATTAGTATADAVETLIWETRRLFRDAAAAADDALAMLRISAGDRMLIEFLAKESRPISLAELARKRAVSRQHIHQSLGRLRNPRWVERTPDPIDARSVLLRLSAEGRALWKEIRAIDRALLRRIAKQMDAEGVEAATQTLRTIRAILNELAGPS